MKLGFCAKFRKVKVLPSGARPIACEDAWVHPCRLSIKLYGEGEDTDRGVGMEKAMHVDRCREEGGLWEVLLFGQRQERAVEVAVRQEDDGVFARVWS